MQGGGGEEWMEEVHVIYIKGTKGKHRIASVSNGTQSDTAI